MRLPADELEEIRKADLLRHTRPFFPRPGASVQDHAGRTLANFSSNDYLGLASSSQDLRDTMAKAARDLGPGAASSRLICGSHPAHHHVEDTLASFFSAPAALAFSSGFAAALGTLTSLLRKGDTVILDKLCHASLVDGARLSGATLRVFPHNHLDKLERLLRSSRESSLASARVLVVTEAVFSMDGDRAPLAEIVALKDRYGALLLLDEAHAFGILGHNPGRGLADLLGLSRNIDVHLGTLSKAAGVAGGFVAADRPTIDLLTNRARSFIYSTAPPPALAATAARALDIIASPDGDLRRQRLWQNLRLFADITRAPATPRTRISPRLRSRSFTRRVQLSVTRRPAP